MLPSLLDRTEPDLPPRTQPYNVGATYGFFPPVHLVYVHGFRGDHTSFQRFPTDLHYSLEDRIPSLASHVYPTYKSRKPIQVSAERLMTWLQTLEPGFVILIGHSLGGFVVAEAAMQYRQEPGRSQVIGVIAMDVPYLGIHPHVIVSGIASLFPTSEKPAANEDDLNDTDKINMVNPSDVSSEISVDVSSSSPSPSPSPVPSRSPSPSPSGRSSPSLRDTSAWKLPDLTPGPTLKQNATHFFRKHSRDPIKAMSNWLVSHWEHGSMLLDPSDLRSRYERLEKWNGGEWVNFYTETVPEAYAARSKSRSRSRSRSPNPIQPSMQERSMGVTSHGPEKKEVKINFPEPRPCSPAQAPLSTESEVTLGKTEGGLSTFGNSAQGDVPTIKFPEPEAKASPSASPGPTTINLGSSTILQPTEKSERPATEQEPAPPYTSSVLSLVTEPIKAAVNPNNPGMSQDAASDTASMASQPDSSFPLPHPPLNDEQQKKHDKVVNKLVKQQRKEDAQAVKAAQKEEKAAAKAEEKKAKEEPNVLKKPAPVVQEEAALAVSQEADKEKVGRPRHFIITPRDRDPSRPRWEKVAVAGSPSEVDAHCGIFFREKNWEYDGFVERVAKWVQDLCEKKAKDALAY